MTDRTSGGPPQDGAAASGPEALPDTPDAPAGGPSTIDRHALIATTLQMIQGTLLLLQQEQIGGSGDPAAPSALEDQAAYLAQLPSLEQRIAALREEETALQGRIAEARKQLQTLAEQESRAHRRLLDLNAQAEAAEVKRQAAEAKRTALTAAMAAEQAQMQAQHARWIGRVEQQLDRLESLGQEAATLEGKRAMAEAEASIAEQQLSLVRATLSDLDDRRHQAAAAVAALSAEQAALTPAVQALKDEEAALRQAIAELKSEYEELRRSGRSLTPFTPPLDWPEGVWEPKRWSHDLPLFVHVAIARYSAIRGTPQHNSVTQAVLDTFPHEVLIEAAEEAIRQLTAKYQRRTAPVGKDRE